MAYSQDAMLKSRDNIAVFSCQDYRSTGGHEMQYIIHLGGDEHLI